MMKGRGRRWPQTEMTPRGGQALLAASVAQKPFPQFLDITEDSCTQLGAFFHHSHSSMQAAVLPEPTTTLTQHFTFFILKTF